MVKHEDKGLGSVKRFGTRYGRTVKLRLASIEAVQKKPQKCPYCLKLKAKRLSLGLFKCQTCNAKFTSKAYAIETIEFAKVKEAAPEAIIETRSEEEFVE